MLRLTLVCIGRARAGGERELAARYLDRARLAGRALGIGVDLREIDGSRAGRPDDRKAEEAKAILAALPPGSRTVAFDATGSLVDSVGFAQLIGSARDGGVSSLAFVVGGPDGIDPAFRLSAHQVIAFGPMTWPHQLVRIMAGEQIYRAVTILAGHPYHRV